MAHRSLPPTNPRPKRFHTTSTRICICRKATSLTQLERVKRQVEISRDQRLALGKNLREKVIANHELETFFEKILERIEEHQLFVNA